MYSPNFERDKEIVKACESGMDLEDVASRYGISAQRVQIIVYDAKRNRRQLRSADETELYNAIHSLPLGYAASSRIFNKLIRRGIKSLSMLKKFTRDEIRQAQQFGPKTIEALAKAGLLNSN